MAARSKARKRALDILFASELRSEDPVVALERAIEAGEGPTNDYTTTLVRGVVEHRERIDEVLTTYSKGWTLSRMPAVDSNVLRIGVYELMTVTDQVRELFVERGSHEELRKLCQSQGMSTLQEESLRLVETGVTTLAEVMRTIYVAGAAHA